MNIRITVVRTGNVQTTLMGTVAQAKQRAMTDAVNYLSGVLVEAQNYPPPNWEWGTLGMVQWRGGSRRVVGFIE